MKKNKKKKEDQLYENNSNLINIISLFSREYVQQLNGQWVF
jgi:hypothetical protein